MFSQKTDLLQLQGREYTDEQSKLMQSDQVQVATEIRVRLLKPNIL